MCLLFKDQPLSKSRYFNQSCGIFEREARIVFEDQNKTFEEVEAARREAGKESPDEREKTFSMVDVYSYFDAQGIHSEDEMRKNFNAKDFLKDQKSKNLLSVSEERILEEYEKFDKNTTKSALKIKKDALKINPTDPVLKQEVEDLKKQYALEKKKIYDYNVWITEFVWRHRAQLDRSQKMRAKEKKEIHDSLEVSVAKAANEIRTNWRAFTPNQKRFLAVSLLATAIIIMGAEKGPFARIKTLVTKGAGLLLVGGFINLATKLGTGKTAYKHFDNWVNTNMDKDQVIKPHFAVTNEADAEALVDAIGTLDADVPYKTFGSWYLSMLKKIKDQKKDPDKDLPIDTEFYNSPQAYPFKSSMPRDKAFRALRLFFKKYYVGDEGEKRLKAEIRETKTQNDVRLKNELNFTELVSGSMAEDGVFDMDKSAFQQFSDGMKAAGGAIKEGTVTTTKTVSEATVKFCKWFEGKTHVVEITKAGIDWVEGTWNNNVIYFKYMGNGVWAITEFVFGGAVKLTSMVGEGALIFSSFFFKDLDELRKNLQRAQDLVEFMQNDVQLGKPEDFVDDTQPRNMYHLGQYGKKFQKAFKATDKYHLDPGWAHYIVVSGKNYKECEDELKKVITAKGISDSDQKFFEPVLLVRNPAVQPPPEGQLTIFFRGPLSTTTEYKKRFSGEDNEGQWRYKFNRPKLAQFDRKLDILKAYLREYAFKDLEPQLGISEELQLEDFERDYEKLRIWETKNSILHDPNNVKYENDFFTHYIDYYQKELDKHGLGTSILNPSVYPLSLQKFGKYVNDHM